MTRGERRVFGVVAATVFIAAISSEAVRTALALVWLVFGMIGLGLAWRWRNG